MPGSTDADFTRAFLGAMVYRAVLGLGAMACALAGGGIGSALGGSWSPFAGALIGLFVGVALIAMILRRRRQTSTATGREPSATHSLHEPG